MLLLGKHLHFEVYRISLSTDACCFTSVGFTPRKCVHFARKYCTETVKNRLCVR